MANFNGKQIKTFVEKWFKTKDLDLDGNEWQFKQWWQTHGISWTEQLSAAIIKYRHIG